MQKAIPLPLVRSYTTCINNDYLYLASDASLSECPKCKSPRATTTSETKSTPVRVISVADKIAELLICDEFRDGMQEYASTVKNFSAQQAHGRKTYRDVFDGEIYQNLIKSGTIDDTNFNIILKLDVDGFTCSSSKDSMVMVNAVILSLDPSER